MTGPLLQPSPRWRVLAAFGAAAAIHFTALAIAGVRPKEQIVEPPSAIPDIIIEDSSDQQSTIPIETSELPTPTPTDESVIEENPTPTADTAENESDPSRRS